MEWILMLGGAAIGGLSGFFQTEQQKQALQKKKEQTWAAYELGKAYADEQFGIQKEEAFRQAGVAQNRLGEGVRQGAEAYNQNMLAQAYRVQDAQIEMASNVGASIVSEGMSGTRGNGAGELVRAYAQEGLNRGLSLQERQNASELQGMATQASQSMQDIAAERNSWLSGGYRARQHEAQDNYNRSMAQLGVDAIDWEIEQANGTQWASTVLGALGGASSGFSLGRSMNKAGIRLFDNPSGNNNNNNGNNSGKK